MADDQQQPRDGDAADATAARRDGDGPRSGGDRPGGGDVDRTQEHRWPAGPDREPAADETARHPALDETAAHPAIDETAPHRALDDTAAHTPFTGDDRITDPDATRRIGPGLDPDATRRIGPGLDPDATRRIGPGVDPDRTSGLPPAAAGWSARAAIPPPEAPQVRGTTQRSWTEEPPPGERRWWVPALIALVGLLLLAVFGYGLWLLLGGGRDNGRPGAPSVPSLSATAPEPPGGTEPSPAEPSAPTATTEAGVVVPRLIGLSEADARATLDDVGLRYRLAFEENGGFPPGHVVTTDPPSGTVIPRGSQIVLVIATAPPTTEPPAPTSAPPTTAGPSATG
jgi:hypothetical protein